jgi:tRNA pseudouridine38-40 synthase
MANWSKFYLVRIEFLGFRFHGWQKQNDLKSVHLMVDKTVAFVLNHKDFKTLGCGRTDAKVSADDYAFELFLYDEIADEKEFIRKLNKSFPSDIRAKSIQEIDASFNIIQTPKIKEYHYYFSIGEKSHPFNAPLINDLGNDIDLESMKEGALLFNGKHNFKRFTAQPTEKTILEREVLFSKIEETDRYQGNFFPEKVYVFKVESKGFLRYQVRLMMGLLIQIGKREKTIDDLKEMLANPNGEQVDWIAQASCLNLHRISF